MTHTHRASALILAVAVFGDAATVFAQATSVPAASAATPVVAAIAAPASVVEANTVRLLAGRSTIVDVGMPIARVSLTSPDVADAMVTTPNQLLVNGKVPGTISMFVWDRGGALRRYEVNVGRDLSQLNDQMRQLFPGERVEVQSTGRNVVISGNVSSKEVAEKVANVAAGYVEKKDEVVSLLQVRQGPAANQVLLKVRFAEVSRSAMSDLGASLYGDGAKNLIGRSTTGQFGQPASFDQQDPMVGNTQIFSDFLNLFLFSYKHQVGAVIKALQTKGLFQSLAEPNLVAESGKEASFLAGGEIPVPVVQGNGGNIAVSVMWKEFGVRLNFTPTVNGNNVRLKVRPEVSTLDFGNAITLQGFRIPALSTRRTETELELENGQTFAIAGLMNNTVSTTMRKIPGIGDIPVLGALFRSKGAQKDQTELVVMITPEILRAGSPGVSPTLPRAPEKFLEPMPEKKTQEMPPAAFTPGRTTSITAAAPPAAVPPMATSPTGAPARTASAKSPAAAAATLSALTPHSRTVTSAAPPAPAAPVSMPAVAPPAPAVAPLLSREPLPGELEIDDPTIDAAMLPLTPAEPTPVTAGGEPSPVSASDANGDSVDKTDQAKTVAKDDNADKVDKAERATAKRLEREQRQQEKAQAKRAAEAARKQRDLEKRIAEAEKKNHGAFAAAQ